jgi:cysteinyl-tRNA synthetase
MDADFNTPMALAAIHSLATAGDLTALAEFGEILGINFLREKSVPISILQDIRSELRARKQFEFADLIRDRMVSAGITVTDSPL